MSTGMRRTANGLKCAWRLPPCRLDSTSPRIVARFNARTISSSPTLRKSDSKPRNGRPIRSLLDLPLVPPAPELPAPYIDGSQLTTYVWPLYSRRWTITTTYPKHSIVDGNLVGALFTTPNLTRRYNLSSFDEVLKMQQGIREIVASDKHEPQVVFRRSRQGHDWDRSIEVGTFTHQCQGSPGEDDSTFVSPGITLHDARLAIRTEKLYSTIRPQTSFHVMRGTPVTIEDIRKLHQYSIERTRKRLPWIPALPIEIVKVALPDEDASKEYCTDTDFSRTIVPLYCRGWNILYKDYHNVAEDGKIKALKIPTLSGFYKFKSFEDAMSFAQDSMTTLEGQGSYDIFVAAQTVKVQTLSQNTEREITIRDARSAVMVESLFTEKYRLLARDSGVQAFPLMTQPTSVEDLKRHPAGKVRRLNATRAEKYAQKLQRTKETEKAASALNSKQATFNSTT